VGVDRQHQLGGAGLRLEQFAGQLDLVRLDETLADFASLRE
jgi:hypothetical protein